jgi:serine phosphatase RsbU (regulator of sigma subunit)
VPRRRLERARVRKSASNRYATFFYGQYNAATRRLQYVNGDHNPPMVFRQSAHDIIRLDAGGPVIGLMESCCYVQGCAMLEPGDVLIAFTDGVSEAMNAIDEEWGEERLIKTVQCHPTRPACELIERIMQSTDLFVGQAPQHDDMTLVVTRLVT